MSMKKIAFAAVCAMMMGASSFAQVKGDITVLSREEGSGTRGAFIELFGIEKKDASGKKVDMTTDNADITNSTSVMLTSVMGNPQAIGYVSMGSLKGMKVKALEIDGVAASVDGVRKGTYKAARPFNIATKGALSKPAQAFLNFIMSRQGQAVVEKNGYIAVNSKAQDFAARSVSGKVVVAGSSSVTPVMEKLKEAYVALNPEARIEIQQSDSTTGVKSAISGICDLGMASRELKASELKAGLTPTVIAMDGIAVILNEKNGVKGLSSSQVRDIYTGKTEKWEELR